MGSPGLGRVASVSGTLGRVDWKTMQEPSGDIAGDESGHSPEKGARVGRDQWPSTLCDSTIAVHCAVVRVKKRVLPSGEKVGAPSLAGPDISPGAKICGAGAEEATSFWRAWRCRRWCTTARGRGLRRGDEDWAS